MCIFQTGSSNVSNFSLDGNEMRPSVTDLPVKKMAHTAGDLSGLRMSIVIQSLAMNLS